MGRIERYSNRLVARVSAVVALAALATGPVAVAAHADEDQPRLRNGGFESGTLAGWRTAELGITGDGWSVATGTVSPVSSFPIPAPPQGRWQAVTDQTGPGSHILYRDIVVKDDDLGLRMKLWYQNLANVFFTPRTLDPFSRPNQQLRVDLIRPHAPVRSMEADDVLATIFRTRVGDPSQMGPRVLRRDLSRYEGRTVRLRIAEVDNQFFFQAGVDAVRVVEIDDEHPHENWPNSSRPDLSAGASSTTPSGFQPVLRYAG